MVVFRKFPGINEEAPVPYFTYNDAVCYYESFGEGVPVLFLHGNTASLRMFSELAPAFAESHRVLLLDFLGHARSTRIPKLAADLWYDEALQAAALLSCLGAEPAHIIGVSGGALAAINLALEYPELCGKVIADSFEGESPLGAVIQNIRAEREASKRDAAAQTFYRDMHGYG